MKRRWHSFQLRAIRQFGRVLWNLTFAALSMGSFVLIPIFLLPPLYSSNSPQEWLSRQITYNGPVLVGGLFFLGLGFLVSLLIDTVFNLSHSFQIKGALFRALNHQSYSDSLQSILDEATKPTDPAFGDYLRTRRWISAHITHDLGPDEIPPALGNQHVRRIVKHLYRTSAALGLLGTVFYTVRGIAYGWNTRLIDRRLLNAAGAAVPHVILGLTICGVFLLIYTLIVLGDHVREENRERAILLQEMTGSRRATVEEPQDYQDTLGLHSLEEEHFSASQSSLSG